MRPELNNLRHIRQEVTQLYFEMEKDSSFMYVTSGIRHSIY